MLLIHGWMIWSWSPALFKYFINSPFLPAASFLKKKYYHTTCIVIFETVTCVDKVTGPKSVLLFSSMLLSGTWSLRISRLHHYLRENLKAYGTSGCAIYPPSGLELAPSGVATELTLVYKSYPQNLTNPADLEGETQLQTDLQTSPGNKIKRYIN